MRVINPYPLFLDGRGALLDGGFIYIGEAGGDPETDPIETFTDEALTQPIDQPLRTLGGYIVRGQNIVSVFVAEEDFSIRVRDSDGTLVFYKPSVADEQVQYQPLDSDLTAIAALSTTGYGRALLTLANQAALQAAVGLPAALALTGGTMTGAILRQGAGAHGYAADSAYASLRFFFPNVGDPDPGSQAGDIVFWLS